MTLRRRRRYAEASSSRPLARSEELIVEAVDEDLLVYDQRSDEAHSLSAPAARVWRRCDGRTDIDALSTELDLDSETVVRALAELDDCGLLDAGPVAGVTRREATTRVAKIGAAAAAAPLIYSIVSPFPAAADSLTALCEKNNIVCRARLRQHSPHGLREHRRLLLLSQFRGPASPAVCTGDPQHCCTSPDGLRGGGWPSLQQRLAGRPDVPAAEPQRP